MFACPVRNKATAAARLVAVAVAVAQRSIATLNPHAHIPVLLDEAIAHVSAGFADKQRTKLFCDATFGNGGYTKRLLDTMDCRVIAVDQDPEAYDRAVLMASLPEYRDRLLPIHGKFGDLVSLVHKTLNVRSACLDGILFDIGLSSNQLDSPNRGFSFRTSAPLDMRMCAAAQNNTTNNTTSNDATAHHFLHNTLTAEAIVNNFSEQQLADIIYTYGEERRSRVIARAIVSARKTGLITTTTRLADIVAGVAGRSRRAMAARGGGGGGGDAAAKLKHPAVRTFQALRIYINDELRQLENGLRAAEHLLLPRGALVVVTFHSLEDRIAKQFLAQCAATTTIQKRGVEADTVNSTMPPPPPPPYREMDALDIDLMRRRGADARSDDTELLKLKGRSRRHRIEQKALKHQGLVDASLWRSKDEGDEGAPPSFELVTRKTVAPTRDEVSANPRARSAKLRAALRTDAPPLSRL
ncbi:hypothetical protein HDU86_002062 [Geranomyces michiganensis]|nr:hypothetical protein HDU86_002062 [Geranomyces michiganensis]